MRVDGRQPGQLRPVTIEVDYLATAEGSALISVGSTRVLKVTPEVLGMLRRVAHLVDEVKA